ncbi:hypothetical protein D3C80_1379990 [compost metagenome]
MADPGQILLAGGGVHHQAVEGIGQEIGDEVIDDAAFRVEHAAVEGLAGDGELGHVVGQQVLQEGFDPLAGQIDDGHVGDIEHARIAAHRVVLFQLGAVVDGHFPTVEVHHLGASFQVFGMQYSSLDHRCVSLSVRDNARNPLRLPSTAGGRTARSVLVPTRGAGVIP